VSERDVVTTSLKKLRTRRQRHGDAYFDAAVAASPLNVGMSSVYTSTIELLARRYLRLAAEHQVDAIRTIFPVFGLSTTTRGSLVEPGGHRGGSGDEFDGRVISLLTPIERLSE
jgi:hypothetical protein